MTTTLGNKSEPSDSHYGTRAIPSNNFIITYSLCAHRPRNHCLSTVKRDGMGFIRYLVKILSRRCMRYFILFLFMVLFAILVK